MEDQAYKNGTIIKDKRDLLYRLQSKRANTKLGQNRLKDFSSFITNSGITNLDDLREHVESQFALYNRIRSILQTNTDIHTLIGLETKLSDLPSVSSLDADILSLEKEIEQLFLIFNLCPTCLGKRTVYDRNEAEGDPYARSSDYQKKCDTCKGTGKHPSKN